VSESKAEPSTALAVKTTAPGDMVNHLVKCRYFKDVTTESQAAVRMRLGHALGIDEASAMMGLFINAQGKLSMSANLMARCIKACKNDKGVRKYKYRILEHTDKKCSIQVWERLDDAWEEVGHDHRAVPVHADRRQ
jgi:hypothetical protein